MSRLFFALVYVYANVVPQRDSSVNGFSADSSSCVERDSIPLTPVMNAPNPGIGKPNGEPPLSKKAPFGKRLPSVNAKPFLLTMRASVALVFHSPTLLRMPMLY